MPLDKALKDKQARKTALKALRKTEAGRKLKKRC